MKDADSQQYILELEQKIALLEEALKQSARIREQWHEANRQLTESRRALKNSETLHRQVTTSAFDAILIINPDNIIEAANSAAERIFGYPENAWHGMNISTLIPDERELKLKHHDRQITHSDGSSTLFQHIETFGVHQSGHTFPIELTLSELNLTPLRMVATIRDISERKRILGELEQRVEERTASLKKLSEEVEQAAEAILITDKDGTIEYINQTFTRFTGYTLDEVVGKNPRILKSGNQDTPFYTHMWDTITHGKHWQSRVVEKRKDGTFYPALLSIAPIFNDGHQITHYVGYHQDMTELQNLEEQFHQAQKMEAVGVMVGGIAHEFNNMLAGITGNLYMAKFEEGISPEVTEFLNNIEELSFNAAEMIQQLLAFSRKASVSKKNIPLTMFCKETLKLQAVSLPESINLKQRICREKLTVKGDPILLQQALINLINNARDALESTDDPTITVELNAFEADKAFEEHHPELSSREFARLTISDNGHGVSQDHLEHIFEPFFTTKAIGKGTGLGLSMVHGTVQSHGGTIEVEPASPQGTSFHLYLPLVESLSPGESSDKADQVIHGHGETIMLADDESNILSIGQSILEKLNYHVITASNGQEAIDKLQKHHTDIDLIILDLVMPRLGGVDAAEQIRQHYPDMPIIFSTGYDIKETANMGIKESNAIILHKPFSITTLSQLISESLSFKRNK